MTYLFRYKINIFIAQFKRIITMGKTLMTISIKMITPVSDLLNDIEYRKGNIIHSIEVGLNEILEVYHYDDRFEWRKIEIIKNKLGLPEKVVRYDSKESMYNDSLIALRDSLIFIDLLKKDLLDNI